jgi:hypothetical protein
VEQALKEARRDADHANLAQATSWPPPATFVGAAGSRLNGALRRMVTDDDPRSVEQQNCPGCDVRLINRFSISGS